MPPLCESYQAVGLQAFEEMQPEYNLIAGVGTFCYVPSAVCRRNNCCMLHSLRRWPARAGALRPHVDLLLCETLSTVTEGLAAASAASASSLPFWVSWTLDDGDGRALLRSGESLQARGDAGAAAAVAAVAAVFVIAASGNHCCTCTAVSTTGAPQCDVMQCGASTPRV